MTRATQLVSGGSVSTISVNGEQVYGYTTGALESRYSLSFTNSITSFDDNRRLVDFFTNPVVSMANGKLTVNLGEPVAGLKPAKNAIEESQFLYGEILTISDPANIFIIKYFTGECSYSNDKYNCSIALIPGRLEDRQVILVYADKPVTVGGNIEACVYNDSTTSCTSTLFPFSFKLQNGWNVVSYELDDYATGENYKPVLKTITANFSGPGGLKWEIQRMVGYNQSDDFVVPEPVAAPTGLIRNQWTDGSITSSATGSAAWYSFSVTDGEKYYVWLERTGYMNAPKTLDAVFSLVYSGGPAIFIGTGGHIRHEFTADRNGTVLIRVAPAYFGSTGTFALTYTNWINPERPDYP